MKAGEWYYTNGGNYENWSQVLFADEFCVVLRIEKARSADHKTVADLGGRGPVYVFHSAVAASVGRTLVTECLAS